jgi:hypothetical protein
MQQLIYHSTLSKSRSARIWDNTHINNKNRYKNEDNGYDQFRMHTYMYRRENGEEGKHTHLEAGQINDS